MILFRNVLKSAVGVVLIDSLACVLEQDYLEIQKLHSTIQLSFLTKYLIWVNISENFDIF